MDIVDELFASDAASALTNRAAREIARLRDENAKLSADAERLGWLERKPDEFANIDRITSACGKFNGLISLRDAIDAAMQKGG